MQSPLLSPTIEPRTRKLWLPDSVVLHYDFQDENIIDSCGTYDGTNNGTTRIISGNRFARDFDGATQYISCGLVSTAIDCGMGPGFAVEFVFKLDVTASKQLCGRSNGANQRAWNLSTNSSSILLMNFYDDADATSSNAHTIVFSSGVWYHVIATYLPVGSGTSKCDLYINGVRDSATTMKGPLSSQAGVLDEPILIGKRGDSASGLFDGQMKFFRIHNRYIRPGEAQMLYAAAQPIMG